MADLGKMRDRVRFESPKEDRDSRGQPVKKWVAVCTVWAEVRAMTGRELWQAQQVQQVSSDMVIVRRRADLEQFGPKLRAVVETQSNRVLNVVGVRRTEASGEFLEIACLSEGLQG